MPHSLVLNLLPQSPSPQFLTGRHLHALFLTLVSSVDTTLSDRLHDSTADKAFTLSPLQINSPLLKGGKVGSKLQCGCRLPVNRADILLRQRFYGDRPNLEIPQSPDSKLPALLMLQWNR